jgi:oligoendopeptidase F
MPHASVRTCVPARLNGADWSEIEPVLTELQHRVIATPSEFEQWLIDRSELEAACDEARANLYIASSCDTESKPKSAAFAAFVENIAPRLDTIGFELDKRQVALADQFRLNPARYAVLERTKRARVEIFRPQNVPIQTELDKLGQEYAKVAGAQTVNFDSEERTLPQMGGYLLETDRARRESAWRAISVRRLADRETLDALLDQMIQRRDRIARNAGCPSVVEYIFKDKLRFDYTPAHCERFWSAVEKQVVPMVRRLAGKRRAYLGVPVLRPWDLSVDTKGRPGLKPFDGGRDLFDKTAAVFDALDQRLSRMFRDLGPGESEPLSPGKTLVSECLDLDSRKGKRPGGYQYNRARTRRPFIFMNAAGLHRDAMTMVHEAGHAFHSMLSASDPLVDYRHSPIEFAEVASMSMEHLTMPHWGKAGAYFPDPSDLRRAQAEHLERSATILAWIATIDSFQHWMYRNPGHTHQQRDDHWRSLDQRFGEPVSWEGLDAERRSQWQKQSHLFSHPLYYIEYGIAQLGALQLWLKSKRDGQTAAIDAYIKALSLGGSKPLPDLFAAADITFDFGESIIARIVEAVETELAIVDI